MSRLTIAALALGLLFVAGACASGDDEGAPAESRTDTTESRPAGSLDAQTVDAGGVEVSVTPTEIDETAGTFTVLFDTHSVELDADLPTSARLRVGDNDWPAESWDGDPPGGHHREGTLKFAAGGPASGTAVLTLDDLPEPVELTWELP